MIYNVSQYVDEDGRQIYVKQNIQNKDLFFMGTFSVTIPTPFGPQDAQIQFDFERTEKNLSLEDELELYFNKFDELAEAEYEQLIKEMKEKHAEQKIITPDQSGEIILP